MTDHVVEHATCLGCGCACDDITVVVREDRIVEPERACSLGRLWFGTGAVPARVRTEGARDVPLASALDAAATLLRDAARPLVYLSADISCEAQRTAIAVADVLGAMLDSVTSGTAGTGVLAAQRRGRASATLGEVRNRADGVVFWGVDPAIRYPRFASRYAPDPVGLYIPAGRRGRVVMAIDVGTDRAPADADHRVAFTTDEEVTAIELTRAAVIGRGAGGGSDSLAERTRALADGLRGVRYLAIVVDGEPVAGRDPRRAEAMLRLVEALNGPTRCVLVTLRAGGNRSGADAVMTWQTGYPMAVDFLRGAPRYRPEDGAAAQLARGEIDTVLVVGSPLALPDEVRARLGAAGHRIAIGPRASESPYETDVAIDTGIAGIHEAGTATRMDDIPLPLRPALRVPSLCDTAATLRTLAARLVAGRAARRPEVA